MLHLRCIVEGEQANMLVDNTDQREEVLADKFKDNNLLLSFSYERNEVS